MEKEYLISYVLYRKHITPADTIIGSRQLGHDFVDVSKSLRSDRVFAPDKRYALTKVSDYIRQTYGDDAEGRIIAITCLDD